MPLLTSPIDGSPMKQINRFGIEIDVCPVTGGIWLDKGELEKLMKLLKEEAAQEHASDHGYNHDRDHDRDRSYARSHHDRDDYDDDDHYKHGKGGYKKKSKVSRMMDIFDF